MQFLYPAYLFGLSLIAIPIIIHLFKLRRYKTVYFSSLKFLKDAQDSHRNKSRLKDILLLIARILLIISLVLAFAQPYQESGFDYKQQSTGVVGLYVDASHSMENQIGDQSILDKAKTAAIKTVNRYPLGTSFLIIDESNESSYYTHLDRYSAIDNISRLSISHTSNSLSKILNSLQSRVSIESHKKDVSGLHIYSDFQKSSFDFQSLPDSSDVPVSLHSIRPDKHDNIYIDSCWLEQPVHHYGSRISISGRIFNSGSQSYQQFPLVLMVNDSLAARTSIELAAGTSRIFSISYLPIQNGEQKVEFKLNDYPVDFDNSFFLSFNLNQQTKVCHLYAETPNQYLSSALNSDSAFSYSEYPLTAFPESDFSMYQTLIISGLTDSESIDRLNVKGFVENGGNLIIFPDSLSSGAEINQVSKLFGAPNLLKFYTNDEVIRFAPALNDFHSEISLNPESTLNWPHLNKYFSMSRIGSSSQVLLEGNSKRPLMVSTKADRGIYIVSGISLESASTNIGEHPLFIPLLYFLSTAESRQSQIYSRIGSHEAFPLSVPDNSNQQIVISDPESEFETIPQQETHPENPIVSIYLNEYIGTSGIIRAKMGNAQYTSVAMNYPRQESVLEYYSQKELQQLTHSLGANIFVIDEESEAIDSKVADKYDQGTELPATRILLIFALLMLITETLLFRVKT